MMARPRHAEDAGQLLRPLTLLFAERTPAPASMLGPPAELGRRRSHPQDGLARVEQPRAPPGARASATSSARAALMSAVALTRASFATGAGAPATFLNAGYVVLGRSAGAPSVLSATRRRASSAAAA